MATKTFKIGLSNSDKATMKSEISSETISALIDEFSTSSTYAVGDYVSYNGTIYRCVTAITTAGAWDSSKWEEASLNDVIDDVNEAVASVADKCNPDGDYSGSGLRAASAEVADNLTPYSNESGDTQDSAFILEGTGTGNGTESVDTGSYAIVKEKRGNVLCVNQLVRSQDLSNDAYNGITRSRNNTNQTITYNGTVSAYTNNSYFSLSGEMQLVVGHKYYWNIRLISGSVDISERTTTYCVSGYCIMPRTNFSRSKADWNNYIFTQGDTVQAITLSWGADAGVKFNNAVFKCVLVDLTQLYNNSIPSGLTADTFFRYYQGSLAYNLGQLVASNGRYLKSVGRNAYNPSETYNSVIPNRKYFASKSTTITYYDKDKTSLGTENVSAKGIFTTPSNCIYINSSVSSITISLVYYKSGTILEDGYIDGSNNAIEYPYEELENIDTGSETLLSAGSVYDSKLPSGEITHRVGSRAYESGDESDSDVITDGTTTYYPLENPTTSQGTSFKSNIAIDDFGSLLADNTSFNGVPMGNAIFYPVDYKAFTDTLYNSVGGDGQNILPKVVKVSGTLETLPSGSPESLKQVLDYIDNLHNIEQENIGGTLRQCLCVKESLDFDNTDFVDLGTLSWSYSGGVFQYSGFSQAKMNVGESTKSNIICSKYTTESKNGVVNKVVDKSISVGATTSYNGYLLVYDTTYTDATTFKNAMKGILLAYEKGE